MKIARLASGEKDEFLEWNRRIFPDRSDLALRLDRLVLANPLLAPADGPPILVARADGRIVGQFVLSPFPFRADEALGTGFWGWDYFVLESHRTSGAGAFLAAGAIRGFRPYFGIGPSDRAMEISRLLKVEVLGGLRKFLWVRRVAAALGIVWDLVRRGRRSSGPQGPLPSWPSRVAMFDRRTAAPGRGFGFGSAPLEFLRPPAFLQWRFFDSGLGYGFFEGEDGYFVVRRRRWRGMSLLALVDFRCPLGKDKPFASIVDAAKALAAEVDADGVLAMSSHRAFDRGLAQRGFVQVGGESALFTNAPWAGGIAAQARADRLVAAATMGDSDVDLNL